MPQYLNLPMILVLVGGLLAATGAFMATLKQNQEKLASATERAKFESDLRAKSEEIAELNKKIAASVTGGSSFCYALPFGDRAGKFIVTNDGDFPLYDVSVRIVDLDEFEKMIQGAYSIEDLTRNTLQIGNLAPRSASAFGPLPGDWDRDYIRLNLFFSARNGFVTQELRLRRVDGTRRRASRVKRSLPDGSTELVHTHVDDEFPRESDGSIAWD